MKTFNRTGITDPLCCSESVLSSRTGEMVENGGS